MPRRLSRLAKQRALKLSSSPSDPALPSLPTASPAPPVLTTPSYRSATQRGPSGPDILFKPHPYLNPASVLDSPILEGVQTPILEAVPDRSTPTSSLALTKISSRSDKSRSSLRLKAARRAELTDPSSEELTLTTKDRRSRLAPFIANIRAGLNRPRASTATSPQAPSSPQIGPTTPFKERNTAKAEPKVAESKHGKDSRRSGRWFERGTKKLRADSDPGEAHASTGGSGHGKHPSRQQVDGSVDQEDRDGCIHAVAVVAASHSEEATPRSSRESDYEGPFGQFWAPC